MLRALEWILATAGATISIVVAAIVIGSQPADAGLSFVLVGLSLTGFAGFLAVAFDNQERSAGWGRLTWLVAGILTALVFLGAWSFNPILIPAALAFLGAAILADRRRSKRPFANMAFYVGGALGTATAIVLANAASWL